MKINRAALSAALSVLLTLCGGGAMAQQSNFQLSPAPIPYPYFEPGRADYKLTGSYFTISADQLSFRGGGLNVIGRKAFSEAAALDGQIGFLAMNGEMPGFALPFLYSGSVWTPVIDGKGKLTGFSLPLSMNLEIQPANGPAGSLIFFGGPNVAISSLLIQTPYHAVAGVTPAAKTLFEARATTGLMGLQGGVQAAVNLGPFKIAPFAVMVAERGTVTFTFHNGYRGTDTLVKDSVVDIEPFTLTSFGADIIFMPWNLSLGTLWQQAAAKKSQDGYKTFLMQLSWHFRSS